MKRILMTGSDGFLGRIILSHLESKGHQVVPLRADICDVEKVQSLLASKATFDSIIHLAAISNIGDCEKDPASATKVNVMGTTSLGRLFLKYSPQGQFVFFSTAQVYDWTQIQYGQKATEDFPVNPLTTYAKTKLAAEDELKSLFGNAGNLVILRLFNHTHCSQPPSFFLPSVYQQILKGQSDKKRTLSLTLGETSVMRDVGAVQDLVQAVEHLIQKPIKASTYNICSGTAKKLQDLVQELSKSLKVQAEVIKDENLVRKHDPQWICGSFDKFQADYDWKPSFATNASQLIQAFLSPIPGSQLK